MNLNNPGFVPSHSHPQRSRFWLWFWLILLWIHFLSGCAKGPPPTAMEACDWYGVRHAKATLICVEKPGCAATPSNLVHARNTIKEFPHCFPDHVSR